MIGSVTLFGSLVAYVKLAELTVTIKGRKHRLSSSILLPARHVINSLIALIAIALCVMIISPSAGVSGVSTSAWYWLLVVVAAVLGVLITIPIGGADMPVVIALLNSYSGLAACATGFVISNNVLIIAGSLVGASGLILTNIMCIHGCLLAQLAFWTERVVSMGRYTPEGRVGARLSFARR